MGALANRWMDGECGKPTVVKVDVDEWCWGCDAHRGRDRWLDLGGNFSTHAEAFAAALAHAETHREQPRWTLDDLIRAEDNRWGT